MSILFVMKGLAYLCGNLAVFRGLSMTIPLIRLRKSQGGWQPGALATR